MIKNIRIVAFIFLLLNCSKPELVETTTEIQEVEEIDNSDNESVDEEVNPEMGAIRKVFDLQEINGSSSFVFNSFAVDSESNFWMSNSVSGTAFYDGQDLIQKNDLDGLNLDVGSTGFFTTISIDNNNVVWLSLVNEIYTFDSSNEEWIPVYQFTPETFNSFQAWVKVEHNPVSDIHWFGAIRQEISSGFERKKSRGWSSLNGDGLIDVSPEERFRGEIMRDYSTGKIYSLTNLSVYEFLQGKQWNITVFPEFLQEFNNSGIEFISEGIMWRITSTRNINDNGNFLYYSSLNDLSEWRKKDGGEFEAFKSEDFGFFPQVFQDNNGTIWVLAQKFSPNRVGTKNLWKFNPNTIDFEKIELPDRLYINKFVKGKNGKHYFSLGTDNRDSSTQIWEWIPAI